MNGKWGRIFLIIVSYILVAALAASLTLVIHSRTSDMAKLGQLKRLITQCYIGETDETALEDAAAAAMVGATNDRWSYYIPASQYDAHMEQMNNAYVGIGVTISTAATEQGFEILQVDPNGGAKDAGILPGDILTTVDGQSVIENGMDRSRELIRGDAGTTVEIGVIRGQEQLRFTVARKSIQVVVAEGQMLNDEIGLVTIANFDERCAEETISAIESLLQQGAESLIFDVRNNPGGYKKELEKVLDYLLPEGTIFHSVDFNGREEKTQSGESCLLMPMAVLVNGDSYSAAEFFAAALSEYDWATVVGEQTVGKSYFQTTYRLSDGSAVGLSIGKYYTPKGVSLAEVGGLTPDIVVKVDDETAADIYAGLLPAVEDPQIQAAVQALTK